MFGLLFFPFQTRNRITLFVFVRFVSRYAGFWAEGVKDVRAAKQGSSHVDGIEWYIRYIYIYICIYKV